MPEDDSRLESLTLHHLQDVRRRLDQLHELALRHIDRLGRIERDFNDVKSDIILLENRSLTAMTGIIGLKSSTEDMNERLGRIEDKLDGLVRLLSVKKR
jgi:predicted  nucleic acid-binding Zn-ribbon protein